MALLLILLYLLAARQQQGMSLATFLYVGPKVLERQTIYLWRLLVFGTSPIQSYRTFIYIRVPLLLLPNQVLFCSFSDLDLTFPTSASWCHCIFLYHGHYSWCSNSQHYLCSSVFVWTYWYYSHEQLLFLVDNCWSRIEANSMQLVSFLNLSGSE